MKRAATWGGLLLSGLFVWFALRDVDFRQAWHALSEASYWALIPALLVLALANAIRALRWQALFERGRQPPFAATAHAMLIGLLFNSILPARAGEAARVLALWREARVSRLESLATAFAERVYDVFVLLVLLFVAAPFLPRVSWLGKAAVLAAVLAAGIAVAIFALLRWRARPLVFVLRRAMPVELAERRAGDLVRGLASFRHPRTALLAFALTLVSWLLLALSAWLLMLGFDFGAGFEAGLLVTVASALALVIPAAPGGVGQYEAAVIVSLSAFDIDRSRALSYGIVLHALNLLPYLVAGYVALRRHSVAVRRRRLQEAAETLPIEGSAPPI